MYQGTTVTATQLTCPDCGSPLKAEGEVQRCTRHGLFFSYGPRLLVRVPELQNSQKQLLLPWQTLNDLPR